MLLTCPSCSMRYVVADASIGEAGRKVRCASCGHQWFQEGAKAPEIVMDAPPEPPRDIPESVKPRVETPPPVVAADAQVMREQDLIARVCGFFGAFLIFLMMFLMLVVFKGPVVNHFPPSVMFYELIKLAPPVPGTGLVIDQLHAQERDGELVIDGRIINLTSKAIDVPPVAAYLLDEAGAVLGMHPIAVAVDALPAESDADLTITVPASASAVSVRVGFHFPQ